MTEAEHYAFEAAYREKRRDEKERRRYALLQAAATLDAVLAIDNHGLGFTTSRYVKFQADGGAEAVSRALDLLGLIERYEQGVATAAERRDKETS